MRRMPSITLDTNCIIDLQHEQRDSFRRAMEKIVQLAQAQKVKLAVTTRLESEVKHHSTMQVYCGLIQSGSVRVIGSTIRLGHSKLGGSDTLVDEILWRSIAHAVFPNRDTEEMFRPTGNLPKSSLDIDHLYGHLRSHNEFFVTRDGNIVKAKDKLALIGINVLTPEEVLTSLAGTEYGG